MNEDSPSEVDVTPGDGFLTLVEAADLFPKRAGRKLSVKAIRRRIHTGEKGVRLEARRCGGRWFTTRQWVAEHLEAVTNASRVPMPMIATGAVKTPERIKRILSQRHGIHDAR